MAPRSKVERLPAAVKAWLDGALVEGNFAGYERLVEELKRHGYEISKSSLHRYGSAFEERLSKLKMATEQARAVVANSPDDEGAMTEALMRLVQHKVFDVLVNADIDASKVDLSKLTLQVARLARAAVPLKKWQQEARTMAAATLDKAVADAEASGGSLGVDAIRKIREEVYGIFDR